MTELARGRYEIVRTIGGGSQGDTFEGRDRQANRRVAIKALRVAHAKAWKDVELAEREARTLATLDHDRIPHYYDHFEENGTLYLVMELVDGESVAALRRAGRVFGVTDVSRMLEDAESALSYLHGRSPPVIHRDLKPGNVILSITGSYRFVDFGCVRDHLRPEGGSTVVGTFGYMAPEQFQGRASPASDVYGIGATALAMLTGKEPEELPHKGLAIDVRASLPKTVPEPLVKALVAMLEPDPDARAQSIAEALRRGKTRVLAEAPPDEPPPKRDRTRRRDERRARREERRARRRSARLPFVPRLFVHLVLLVTRLVVWLVVAVVVPIVLLVLSILFGRALRRAAEACWSAGRRAQGAIGRAQGWLAGRDRAEEPTPPVRVASEEPRVRVAGSRVRDDEALAETEIGEVEEKRKRVAR